MLIKMLRNAILTQGACVLILGFQFPVDLGIGRCGGIDLL
jgi:hypothetical protein